VAIIDLHVLQMMMTEMVFFEDIPPKVSITEGVEIARKYSTDESSSFVNGILDSVYHSLEDLSVPGE
jgi:N utilization substance protein B